MENIHTLRLLKELDLRHVLLASKLLKLLTHQVELILQEVDLPLLAIDKMLFRAQVNLHRTLLFLHKRNPQHVFVLLDHLVCIFLR